MSMACLLSVVWANLRFYTERSWWARIRLRTRWRPIESSCTPANEQEVKELCEAVQEATGNTVQVAWADLGYTGQDTKVDAQASGIKLREAKKAFVLQPRRWVIERSFGWPARFLRLSRDFERLSHVLASAAFPGVCHAHAAQGGNAFSSRRKFTTRSKPPFTIKPFLHP